MAREDNFVPSRRFREGGLEDLKLSTGGAAIVNSCVGGLAVAKQTKLIIGSDSLQLLVVEPLVSRP